MFTNALNSKNITSAATDDIHLLQEMKSHFDITMLQSFLTVGWFEVAQYLVIVRTMKFTIDAAAPTTTSHLI